MVLLLVRMVLPLVTWTVEELLERKTLEDLLENLLLAEVDDDIYIMMHVCLSVTKMITSSWESPVTT